MADRGIGPASCLVVVRASDGNLNTRDVTSFYKLWEVFIGIQAICVRSNQMGYAYGLGKLADPHEHTPLAFSEARIDRDTRSKRTSFHGS